MTWLSSQYIKQNRGDNNPNISNSNKDEAFVLFTGYPRHVLNDDSKSLGDLGLVPNGVLHLVRNFWICWTIFSYKKSLNFKGPEEPSQHATARNVEICQKIKPLSLGFDRQRFCLFFSFKKGDGGLKFLQKEIGGIQICVEIFQKNFLISSLGVLSYTLDKKN